MVREKYGVRLTPEQRNQLEHLVRAGKSTARVTTRARILLKTDAGWSAPQVAPALDVAEGTVFRIKRRFAEEGLAGALPDRVQANRYRKLEDRGEAHPVSSTGQALNTHRVASWYETFPAQEARRIAKRLEFHYTPKHGSWLNPVLSLPKGWPKSSSAYWSAPVCRDGAEPAGGLGGSGETQRTAHFCGAAETMGGGAVFRLAGEVPPPLEELREKAQCQSANGGSRLRGANPEEIVNRL